MARTIKSVAVCPAPGGNRDQLYMTTAGSIGKHFIEYMRPIMRETDELSASWHCDDSPGLATLAQDSCDAATGDGGYGYSPNKFGLTSELSDDPTDDFPDTGLPAPGTSDHGHEGGFGGINFNVLEAVFFDGQTAMYGLPAGLHGASNLSISCWVPANDILNSGSAILTGPLKKYVDYQNTIGAGSCSTTPVTPSAGMSMNIGQGFTGVSAGVGTDYLALDVGYGTTANDNSFAETMPEWVHLMLAYKASTMTLLVYANATAVGSYPLIWQMDPTSADPSPHTCWAMGAPDPTSVAVPNLADNYDQTYGANNIWTLFGRSWNGLAGTLQSSNASENQCLRNPDHSLAGGLYLGGAIGTLEDVTGSAYLCLPGDGGGMRTSVFELWVDKTYVDWSVQANREKFHTSEFGNITGIYAPVNLGSNGKAPFNTKPQIYCSSSLNGLPAGYTPGKAFAINRAKGNKLRVFGEIQTSPEAPPS